MFVRTCLKAKSILMFWEVIGRAVLWASKRNYYHFVWNRLCLISQTSYFLCALQMGIICKIYAVTASDSTLSCVMSCTVAYAGTSCVHFLTFKRSAWFEEYRHGLELLTWNQTSDVNERLLPHNLSRSSCPQNLSLKDCHSLDQGLSTMPAYAVQALGTVCCVQP